MPDALDRGPGATLSAPWLLGLRWAGLLAVAGVALRSGGSVALWCTLGLAVLSHVGLSWHARGGAGLSAASLGLSLAVDCTLLTAMFAATGGSGSPYTLLYLLPVAIGSLTLRPWQGWALLGFATCGYGSLFLFAPADLHAHDPAAMRLHLLGMFAGFALTGLTLLFAFSRLQAARDEAARRLAAARDLEARSQRVAGLATLAAGAAHELATPLSTILLVSAELKRGASDPGAVEDLELIREEVRRCQAVLSDLSADLGQGEAAREVRLPELVAGAVGEGRGCPVTLDVQDVTLRLPVGLLQQALRRLVDNACQASPRACVRARLVDDALLIEVSDEGPGMSPEVLLRAGEPFFTTRGEAGGRGLGLYFVRSVAEQLGGVMTLDSEPGKGVHVELRVPVEPGS
ncbi:MAG: sensor histidine kinase [Alphaproteobacteria bacterium]|nr:sensor histidine kinase [Alphaproteobacteria bacterium]